MPKIITEEMPNTKYDVFNIIPTCRPLELIEQKIFMLK